MNDTIVIDTDVLIDFSRGEVMAADFLRRHAASATLAVSVVTKMELLVGCRNKAEIRTQARFLKRSTPSRSTLRPVTGPSHCSNDTG